MLYGKYVLNGAIELDKTMADLGIDEPDGLLPIEKTAQRARPADRELGRLSPRRQPGRRSQRAAARLEGAGHVLPLQQLGLQRAGRDLREGDRQDGVRRPRRGAGEAAAVPGLRALAPAHDGLREPLALPRLSPVPVGARHGAARPGDVRGGEWNGTAGRAGRMGQGEHDGPRGGGVRSAAAASSATAISGGFPRRGRPRRGPAPTWRAASSGSSSWCCPRSTR